MIQNREDAEKRIAMIRSLQYPKARTLNTVLIPDNSGDADGVRFVSD